MAAYSSSKSLGCHILILTSFALDKTALKCSLPTE